MDLKIGPIYFCFLRINCAGSFEKRHHKASLKWADRDLFFPI